ncbi:HlyD family efflux transporter periplasmic adaptor subunit [Cypionkella sp.]|uniref:HlyD family efflux transporter periplasmic adaptor subunit n=1 Tax=Cypionkella sp. TaxID=2811411 RepID=UPI002728AA8B|nr:HlyD family efflux transporter periplasmic adaptor subunit [Cypionkella sp.]MDO8986575.1 HlyD family efflux transporter periplasmic adaptor subunit [Cypionkella sp.]MDP1578203.1 HlyD family efflux transporter periplasmic adaptor subunit [Cypionkella sp.]MDP2050764.1 HlyD family efflux transporter periplasmic adaptor subunit [Cypionkella sp.]
MSGLNKDQLPIDLNLSELGSPPRRWFRKRYLLVLLIPVFMFSGGVLGMYFEPLGLQKFYALTGLQPGGGSDAPIALPPDIELPPKMAETMLPTDVVGLARVMPRGDVAVVAAPYGAGDARVAEILVAEGDSVAKGTPLAPLARLDNRTALEGAVLMAEANLAIRKASLMQTRAAVAASRDEAQAALDQAIATAAEATTNLARTEELFQRAVATQATLDSARTAAASAGLAVSRAEVTLTRFASLALDDQPDVVVATRNVEAAEADLARAKLDLDRALVVAPIAGTILDIRATPGQRPPADGIMDMGDTGTMMAEVEVWQDRIAAVQLGQPVELAAPALGQSLLGTVESIGLTVGRQGLISDDAAENKDARVIRVLVVLDDASSLVAARFTNLEVIARIDTTAGARGTP